MNKNNLDDILVMAQKKAAEGMMQAEEDSQPELRRKRFENRIAQITTDIEKYEKIAANRYAKDMKDIAWSALVAAHPEAKEVACYDVAAFLNKFGIELTYTDKKTGLMWVKNGNFTGKKMNWNDVTSWVRKLKHGGYNDWRLPKKEELDFFMKWSSNIDWYNANGFNNIQASDYWADPSRTFSHYTGLADLVFMGWSDLSNDWQLPWSSTYSKNGKFVLPVRASS